MTSFRGHLRYTAAFGVLLALLASEARAGNVTMVLTVSGIANPFTITEGSPWVASGATSDNVQAAISTLNLQLTSDGSSLQFSTLSAVSNNPGSTDATLTVNGTAIDTSSTTSVSFSVLAFQTQFTSPVGSLGTLQSSASNTYGNTTAGDSQTFQSWFDQTNAGAKTTPSIPLTFVSTGPLSQSNSMTAPLTPLSSVVSPYALVNQTSVTMAGAPLDPTDAFTGQTILSATSVPEPSTLALLGIGMTGFLALRRLLKRTAVA